MGVFSSWFGRTDEPLTEAAPDTQRVDELSEQLRQEQETSLLLTESIVELESQLAMDDSGWDRLLGEGGTEFSRAALKQLTALCRLTAIANPLMKRGLGLRLGYVWGGGVTITGRTVGDQGGQDVNSVVQAFLDDPSNQRALTGPQAREEGERALGTDGNLVIACFTAPLTGRVQVRTLPWEQMGEKITNPEDADSPWFYLREWTVRDVDPLTGRTDTVTRKLYYPDLSVAGGIPLRRGAQVRARPKAINEIEVAWDAPVLHVKVNALDGWKWGLPDAYAALPWCRAYKEFLEDWAKIVKALSRFAWKAQAKAKPAAKIRDALAAAPSRSTRTGETLDVGAAAVSSPNVSLEAIPKSGATIDSGSGRPLAAMVAAGLGVPVTMLLGDPGVTGARATAETLDTPLEHEMNLRRELWADVYKTLISYAIAQSVKAPQGDLKGRVVRDVDGLDTIALDGDTDGKAATVDVVFPPLDELPKDQLVTAIVDADGVNKIPPLVIARLLLEALDVDDIDQILEDLTDGDGNFVDPGTTAGDVAVQAFRQGGDPAAAVA